MFYEYDLEEFLFVGFEIGEEVDLFEYFKGKILCFVDDEYDVVIVFDVFEENVVYL